MKRSLTIFFVVLILLSGGYLVYSKQKSVDVIQYGDIQTLGTPTPESNTVDSSNSTEQTVTIYFVALEDDGQSGTKIGCNDSLIPVKREVSGSEPLRSALEALLAYDQQYFGESGYYNALYQSNLQIHEIEIEAGVAKVNLNGEVQLGGTCDGPRFKEQIKATVLQFPTVTTAEILINDRPLEELISQQ